MKIAFLILFEVTANDEDVLSGFGGFPQKVLCKMDQYHIFAPAAETSLAYVSQKLLVHIHTLDLLSPKKEQLRFEAHKPKLAPRIFYP
ncbi:uncharacterized protein LAJ45_07027 [Morchella importuna]|uniref:uncharacterized protein n=1 Tax=Morchella importuna TaxID=1174673 RepID=UPI001E8E8507|nr:uncharacterized protein LAJ45_07027 [Morchella importuna]KAH8149051.1 hypothetical protein LAJ45_07027 [Morchella importuna]